MSFLKRSQLIRYYDLVACRLDIKEEYHDLYEFLL